MNGKATDETRAAELRAKLAGELKDAGFITSAPVEAAFRAVPRHAFVPADTPLEVTYQLDSAVVTKRDEHGVAVSSVSATYIQTAMLEQAELKSGMTVLEIGSGGVNAAMIAEIVGPNGRVVSVDIDPEVTDRATTLLEATGYGDRVTVLTIDAEHEIPGFEKFNAIIVTVGAWDLASAWLRQLAEGGTLVVPLRMNGISRSIAFRRVNDHLASTSTVVCGFVPMQGAGEHIDRELRLPDPNGHMVTLRFDDGTPDDPGLLDGVLATERSEVWSGVTIKNGVSFADLYLWFAGFLPGFCRLAAQEGTELAQERKTWFPFAGVHGDSFAYLSVRPALEGAGVEFGARAYGPHGQEAAAAMVEQIQAWDARARNRPEPMFAYWPTGSNAPTHLPDGTATFNKAHGLVTISWPTG
ncbi:protein-L-isoaspartate(D-aspartate) O-methyltransferase [Sinosporangium album]|uniref:Protein-L-isoaspartate O-methyltransferase n=1 Tax=Sinosporangium album TaxID=504805 RepID=A0A1G8IMQ0_9ACTN|nr:methyltransferase, FxLD system [Sinosporangium album]SDI20239.1 protein-L-isoaspartate(D-aspartate) O-methyltransferase [Sinosporangium album]